MLLEHDRLHVRQVDHHVDDGELQVGELGRDLLQRGRLAEADRDDRRIAVAGEAAQRLLDLRVVGRLEIAELDAGLRLELLRADEDALVEGFVELAALVVDDGRLDRGLRQRGDCREGDAGQRQRERCQPHGTDPLLRSAKAVAAPSWRYDGMAWRRGQAGERRSASSFQWARTQVARPAPALGPPSGPVDRNAAIDQHRGAGDEARCVGGQEERCAARSPRAAPSASGHAGLRRRPAPRRRLPGALVMLAGVSVPPGRIALTRMPLRAELGGERLGQADLAWPCWRHRRPSPACRPCSRRSSR